LSDGGLIRTLEVHDRMYKATSNSMKVGLDKIETYAERRLRHDLDERSPRERLAQEILDLERLRFFKEWERRMFAEHPHRPTHIHRCVGENDCRLRPSLQALLVRAQITLDSYAHDWRCWEHGCETLEHQSCQATGNERGSM
jgi:hypothetical protein